jgi:propanol-preferring alcohol dehydrogenase
MRAAVLHEPGRALRIEDVTVPEPGERELLVQVLACAVCRTDLHAVDGELSNPKLPLVPGHEIVGVVVARGPGAEQWDTGARVGVPWLARTCGACVYCRRGDENLCDTPAFTGYTADGGYAEYAVAHEDYCLEIPPGYADAEAAPLLCAGLIGYRSLKKTGDARRVGIYGFGAAAHIVAQVATWQGREVFAFTRPGDTAGQAFARETGAAWAGNSDELPPAPLDAAIIFAPAGPLVPAALRAVDKGGIVVCGGIHMSDIPSFPYEILWGERTITSVANLARADGEEFLALAPKVPVRTTVRTYPLEEANDVLSRLRAGETTGAAVLIP